MITEPFKKKVITYGSQQRFFLVLIKITTNTTIITMGMAIIATNVKSKDAVKGKNNKLTSGPMLILLN